MKRLILICCILTMMLMICACSEQEPNEEVTMKETLEKNDENNVDSENNTENNNQEVNYAYGFTVNEFKDDTGLNIPYVCFGNISEANESSRLR